MAAKSVAFEPVFMITPTIARGLMRVEAARQAVESLAITPVIIAHLRETARLYSTHYSTAIEGNLLTQEQVGRVIGGAEHFPGRERDEDEVKGYYAALDAVEQYADASSALTEKMIQRLHALVMGRGKARVRPTPYREGQNVMRDSRSKSIVYMPPEAKDVPLLKAQLVAWINSEGGLPVPLKAAVAHYQYATIHPYYDGNGRTARLLTSLILHLGGYGLKGLYALEEYYARDLKGYYEALTVGGSHNYYSGRAGADITGWVAYFVEGMANAFEKVQGQAEHEADAGRADRTGLMRRLDGRQRKALTLFEGSREVTARNISGLFGFQQRTASALCQRWVGEGFLVISDPARKSRRYRLADQYEERIASKG